MLYLTLILKFYLYQIITIKTNFLKFFVLRKEIKITKYFLNFLKFSKIKPEFLKNNEIVFFLNNIKKRYFLNQKQFNKSKSILVDLLVGHVDYTLTNLLIARELQLLTKQSVKCIVYESDFKSRLIANQFGFNEFIFLKKKNFFICFLYFIKSIFIFSSSEDKKNYYNYKSGDFEIGKVSYEHFFRFHKNFKKKNDIFFKVLSLSNSFLYLNFFKKILIKKNVHYLIMGEHQYLPHRIIFNLSLKNKIKIFRRFGSNFDGIKIRAYDKYSERYSHVQKYSKQMGNHFIKELSKNKKLLDKLFIEQRNFNDIGKETNWAKKLNSKTKISSSFLKNNKKYILILPHVMIDGMFFAKWSIYGTPYNWFVETLKIIKHIKNFNWIIKAHPSEEFFHTDLKTKKIFNKFINEDDKHVNFLENNADLKIFEKKIFSVITCFGSSGYEYPSIGIPCITTADTRYEHFKVSESIRSLKKYKYILKNMHKIKKINQSQKQKAKIYWFLRFGINVSFDVLPKIPVAGLVPKNYYRIINSNLKNSKKLKGSFYDSFKYQFKYNNRHSINHQILKDLKLKNFEIKNDI